MNYWRNLFLAFDQLFNAIRGGYHDNTISAEAGYYSHKTASKPWRYLEAFINWAFEPLDGPRHCWDAHLADKNERHFEGGKLAMVGMWLIVLIWVPPISLIIRAYVHSIRFKQKQ